MIGALVAVALVVAVLCLCEAVKTLVSWAGEETQDLSWLRNTQEFSFDELRKM